MHIYPVPFVIKEAISWEIDWLEDIGVLETVEFSHWASPIMPVPKSNGIHSGFAGTTRSL